MPFERITFNPNQMGGMPCIRSLRISVATVISMLAAGMAENEILEEHPGLEREDIRDALLYAAEAARLPPTAFSNHVLNLQRYEDRFGPADLQLASLYIWVHGRAYSSATDFWDGNWLNVTVYCSADGADVWTSGPIIHLSELVNWADDCTVLHSTFPGEATLECMESHLRVKLTIDKRGHMLMRLTITPDTLTQSHEFTFELDQTYLPGFIKACRDVVAQFPLRGTNP